MLLVVGPGLLIVKDSALGDASMVWVELFRLQRNGGQRDTLFAVEERIHTLSYQLNGPLPQWFIHGRFEPRMSRLHLGGVLPFWVGSG